MMLLVVFVSVILTTVHASTLMTVMPSSHAIQMAASSNTMIIQAAMSTAMNSAMIQSAQNQVSESVVMHQTVSPMNNGMGSSAGGMMSSANMIDSSMTAAPAGGNGGSTSAMQVHVTASAGGNMGGVSTSVGGQASQASSVMAANSQSSASMSASVSPAGSVSPTPANSQAPSSSATVGTFGQWTHDCKSICCQPGGWKSNYETLSFNKTRTCPQVTCAADEYQTNTMMTLPCKNNCDCSSAALLKLSSFAFALLILSMLQNLQ